jgi:hypothetical protein
MLRLALIIVGAGVAVAVVAMLMDVAGFPPSGGAIGVQLPARLSAS